MPRAFELIGKRGPGKPAPFGGEVGDRLAIETETKHLPANTMELAVNGPQPPLYLRCKHEGVVCFLSYGGNEPGWSDDHGTCLIASPAGNAVPDFRRIDQLVDKAIGDQSYHGAGVQTVGGPVNRAFGKA